MDSDFHGGRRLLRHALVCSVLLASHVAAAPLKLLAELSPPDIIRDGEQIIGIAPDKVKMIMARAGIAYSIEILAWRRAYMLALKDGDTCIFSTARTPEREGLFKWIGPLREVDWTFYGLAKSGIKLKTLEDARPLRIGGYNGDVRAQYLAARGFNVDTATKDLHNMRKLLAGRIDLWATGSQVANTALLQQGWTSKIIPLLTFHATKLYLACNKSVPDATVGAMQAAFNEMQRDGSSGAIDRKYADWRAPLSPGADAQREGNGR